MTRVLQVLGGLNRGGAETMVMNLYRNVDRNHIQFDFIIHTTEKQDYYDEILALGGRIYSCPRYRLYNDLSYKKWWNSFFRNHNEYTIIHSHIRSTAAIILKTAQKYGLYTISHSHSTSNGKGIAAFVKNLSKSNIENYSNTCFACSQKAGDWLYGEKVSHSDKFHVLKNAINAKQYTFDEEKRLKMRSAFGVQDDFVVGQVGRFADMKNQDFSVSVLVELLKLNKNSKLIFVGDGEYKVFVEKQVHTYGLDDKVLFLGVRSDISDIMQAFDALIFPSTYEGLGIVAVEAQAAGLPVIMSETIPNEVVLTELTKKLPIGDCRMWATKLFECKDIARISTLQQIQNGGYDIGTTAKYLQNFYEGITNV